MLHISLEQIYKTDNFAAMITYFTQKLFFESNTQNSLLYHIRLYMLYFVIIHEKHFIMYDFIRRNYF